MSNPEEQPNTAPALEDFTTFWQNETDPNAMHLIFDGLWIEDSRIVAVQPKPSFLPFFEHKGSAAKAVVNDGSDGTRTRDLRRDRPAL